MEFLALGAIFGYAILIKSRWNAAVEFLPFIVVTWIIAAIYTFALAGVLYFGSLLVLAGGIAAIPVIWFRDRRKFWDLTGELRAPGFIAFFLSAIAYRVFFDGIQFYSWDTFSHWGYATQELLTLDKLDRINSPMMQSDYPPGINLFHYFTLFLSPFTEDRVYFANFLMIAAPLAALISGVGKRDLGMIAVIAALAYLFTSTFGLSIRDIPPDHTLGVLFGGSVLYFIRLRHDFSPCIPLILLGLPSLAILPLIKEIGVVLAGIAMAIAVIDTAIRLKHQHRHFQRWSGAILALMIIAPMAGWFSWHSTIADPAVPKTFKVGTGTAINAWRAIVTGERDRAEQIIFEKFTAALTDRTVGASATGAVINRAYWQVTGQWRSGEPFPETALIPEYPVSLAVLTAIFGVLMGGIVILARDRHARLRLTISFGLLLMGGCGYLLVLLVVYLYGYGQGADALGVRFFERYVGTYVVGAGIVIIGLIACDLHVPGKQKFARLTLILGLVAVAAVTSRMSISVLMRISPELLDTRKHIRSIIDYAERRIQPEARVYVVWQNTSGYEHRILHYDLYPHPVNRGCWWPGRPSGPDASYACRLTAKAWGARLREYDFVLLGKADARFWRDYGSLFDPADLNNGKFLFTIEKRPDGRIKLNGL